MSAERPTVADPEGLFGAIAHQLLGEPEVELGTGFGSSSGLRARGKIFAMLLDGALVVKLPADRCDGLVESGSAMPFQVGRRVMREWVRILAVDEGVWTALMRDARDFVG